MVATEIARGRSGPSVARPSPRDRRATAVAIVVLMTLAAFPLGTPVVQAQTVPGSDIFVVSGDYRILQTNFAGGNRHTHFLDNDTDHFTLSVPVYNVGNAISNVPVYIWIQGALDRTDCVKARRGSESTIPEGTEANPGIAWANFTLNLDAMPPGAWNISVQAFPPGKPPEVEAVEECPTPIARAVENNAATCLQPGVTCRTEASLSNNGLVAYFIKDHYLDLKVREILWCPGESEVEETCRTNMQYSNGAAYNVTPVPDRGSELPTPTFFEIVVEQLGGKPHSWVNASNFGGACNCSTNGFAYELNVTVTGNYIDGSRNVSSIVHTAQRTFSNDTIASGHRIRSEDLFINGLAGNYTVTVKLDPLRKLRRHGTDTTDDVANRTDIQVAYRDFTGNFTVSDFRTTPETAHNYTGAFTISGRVRFENRGPAGKGEEVVSATIYLDNETWNDSSGVTHYNSRFRKNVTFTPTGPNSVDDPVHINFEASNILGADNYLPPGAHVLYAYIDSHDPGVDARNPCVCMLESNESNNLFSIPIYVKDTTIPVFHQAPRVTLMSGPGGINAPTVKVVRPHEGINIFANVTDDDNELEVTINVSLDSNASVYRHFTARKVFGGSSEYYIAQVENMTFHNFSAVPVDGTENWSVRVHAVDSFKNHANSTAVPLQLKGWPIHNASADYIIIEPASYPHANRSWNEDGDPQWKIRVEPNMTGYTAANDHQQFKVSNLAINVTVQATGKTLVNKGNWTYNTPVNPANNSQPAPGCQPYPPQGTQQLPGGLPGGTPAPQPCGENNNTFSTSFLLSEDGAAAGIWNYSVMVTDIAGFVRKINGTMLLEDFKPTIHAANLSGTTAVAPPGTIRVQANISDDDNEVLGAYLNLTRTAPGDNRFVNITLTQRNETASGGETWFLYNQSVDVRRGIATAIGIGGTFTAHIDAVDNVGNWARSTIPGNLNITDGEAPQIVAFGVVPSVVEVGENVTFWANASDATNVTMKLEVFKTSTGQELLFDEVIIPQPTGAGPWNYTYTTNFSAEATHSFRLTPIDSVNTVGIPGVGTLTVRDNLGPKYDVRSPSVVIDGDRYGSATPRIEVVIHDVEGVIASSIQMNVAGLPVSFETLPAPGNLNGYLVSYQVPTNKKFTHNDVVSVNLTARDDSNEELLSFHNFTFIVDDVAPTVRLVSVSPSYRDQPAHVLNVSLNSRFTLAAEDLDGMPTRVPVGGIRYRILGGGPGAAETVYSSPFKINDAAGVYTGPRLYQIQFWAEDDVGNFNRNFNTTTVYVDDTPPALFQFFPQGRSINATFVDDRVGVNRSVVWYRINDQPYVPLSLQDTAGTWTTTLPEGVKGDRISYYLQAWDRLDNTDTFGNATAPYASFDVSNHEPKVRIVTPAEGSRVSRSFELTWEASDEDGDALVFTLYYRAPGRTNFVEMAKIENTATRRYTVDSTRLPDGQYTFRVAAGDGGFVKLAETTVTIINRVDPIGVVSVSGEAVPGGTMLITAEVTKAEATVEARLYLKGELVQSYKMNDEGKDGDVTPNDNIYTARVPIDAAGDYTVEIFTQYREDGELKESSIRPQDAAFSAKLTPGYILSEYGAILALIGLLAAVGIGVAVFVVMRRR